MFAGIMAGITWALETIVLGMALVMNEFVENEEAIFLAPFVSTFLHDFMSAIWATVYNGIKGNLKSVIKALKKKDGKYVVLGAVIGGPVGMTGYVLAVNYMGASIGAISSAIFPGIGAVLAYVFLKEKMQWYRWILLILTLIGVYGLSYSPELDIKNFWLGLAGAIMCSFGWGIEAVVLAKCMTDPEIKDEYALQIRQTTSAIVNGLIIIPVLNGVGFTAKIITGNNTELLMTIAGAAFFATVSYLFYYRAISQLGASKAMALNVSYAAWAMVFTVLLLGDTSVISPLTVTCAVIVLVCGVLAAADYKELFS